MNREKIERAAQAITRVSHEHGRHIVGYEAELYVRAVLDEIEGRPILGRWPGGEPIYDPANLAVGQADSYRLKPGD